MGGVIRPSGIVDEIGEPFQADPGAEVVLETATLRLVARVVDMAYGSGAMPANSYFERVTLELALWQREDAAF